MTICKMACYQRNAVANSLTFKCLHVGPTMEYEIATQFQLGTRVIPLTTGGTCAAGCWLWPAHVICKLLKGACLCGSCTCAAAFWPEVSSHFAVRLN